MMEDIFTIAENTYRNIDDKHPCGMVLRCLRAPQNAHERAYGQLLADTLHNFHSLPRNDTINLEEMIAVYRTFPSTYGNNFKQTTIELIRECLG